MSGCLSSALILVLGLRLGGQAAAAPPEIVPLSDATKIAMTGKAWNPGCPVSLDDLVAVHVNNSDFEGADRRALIVIHKRFADDILAIFNELHEA